MELLKCTENLIGLEQILAKLAEMNTCCTDMSECCDVMGDGDVIRSILVTGSDGKNRAYLTDDGTKPVEVPFVYGSPIETWLNTDRMQTIYFNKLDLSEMYMNGDIVFRKVLELELPQYTTEINLREFIDANNPDNFAIVVVTNNLIQPSLISGNMYGLEVTLKNYNEFQGLSSSGDGITLTSHMKVLNYSWIRGAGGDGGDGGGVNLSGAPAEVGVWESRASYYDPAAGGGYSDKWCNIPQCGTHAYYNRYWGSPGPSSGSRSGAWVMSGAKSGQEYWDINNHSAGHAPVWGDQGYCHFNTSGFWCKQGLYIAVFKNVSASGGSTGNGGAGRGFRVAQDAGWSAGRNGYYSGPTGGFNRNGKNLNLPSSGAITNGDGGHGGSWAEAGTAGTEGGQAGKPAGRSIVGTDYLVDGSITGNLSGVTIP